MRLCIFVCVPTGLCEYLCIFACEFECVRVCVCDSLCLCDFFFVYKCNCVCVFERLFMCSTRSRIWEGGKSRLGFYSTNLVML